MAFHLGCLRALHQLGLLSQVSVVSAVSGGSVLAAMYCSRDEAFEEFEARARSVIREGIQGRIFAAALSLTGLRALASGVLAFAISLPLAVVRFAAVSMARNWSERAQRRKRFQFAGRRTVTRTDLFEMALRSTAILGDLRFDQLPQTRPDLIINAADLPLQTGFRFTKKGAGTWPTGSVLAPVFRLSEAVAASAAYPLLLPAIDREFALTNDPGKKVRFLLTDGGVYDNLGVGVFDPTRPAQYSFAGERVDFIIACMAESGLPTGTERPVFWASRMRAAFSSVHRQLHRSTMSNLHQWKNAGLISGFIMPYLGQDDAKLPTGDGGPLQEVGDLTDYPVDFAPMADDAATRLIARGETQTKRLASLYPPLNLAEGPES